jgi:hypothetical protein
MYVCMHKYIRILNSEACEDIQRRRQRVNEEKGVQILYNIYNFYKLYNLIRAA